LPDEKTTLQVIAAVGSVTLYLAFICRFALLGVVLAKIFTIAEGMLDGGTLIPGGSTLWKSRLMFSSMLAV
jgi:hypothetical protein